MGEIKKHIELKNGDIRKELFEDMAFMSVAEPGAMGAPGEMIIYNMDGKSYCFNYVYDDIDPEIITEAIPVANECVFTFTTKNYPKGWKFMYLGFGNNLLIKEELYDNFSKMIGNVSPAEAYGKWEETAEKILEDKKMGDKKLTEKEVDKIIERVSKNVREAYELLKEARDLSSDIDFDELKNIIDIGKYEETINYITQDLSFMSEDPIKLLNKKYNQKYWEVLDKVYLEKNNLACLLDVMPDKFAGTADEYMWEDLKNEFRKIAYHPDNDEKIIGKVHEFYEIKIKEELTEKSEGFCKDYVNKKGDTGILSGEWWIEEGIAKILENYWRLEAKKGDREPLEEL